MSRLRYTANRVEAGATEESRLGWRGRCSGREEETTLEGVASRLSLSEARGLGRQVVAEPGRSG